MSIKNKLASPPFLRALNGWLTVFWLCNFPPILAIYFSTSSEKFQSVCLLYLALVSIWANVAGHMSAWQAARIECQQAEDADVQQVLDEVKHLEKAEGVDPTEATVC